MTAQTRTQLYSYFETGDFPTQQQFADLIDSSLNLVQTGTQTIVSDISALGSIGVSGAANFGGNLTVANSARTTLTGNVIIGGTLSVSANGGATTLTSLTVTGSSNFNAVTVSGSASFNGNINANGNFIMTASANAAFTGNVTVSGAAKLAGKNDIAGTTTNDNAPAGYIGEYVSSIITSPASLSNNTNANLTTISLTPGDWDVWAEVQFLGAASTTMRLIECGINTASGSITTQPGFFGSIGASDSTIWVSNVQTTVKCGPTRVTLTGTTTYYINALAQFGTSTCTMQGGIFARRAR
jgi:hypothetical protein